jgi:hypothetical protein
MNEPSSLDEFEREEAEVLQKQIELDQVLRLEYWRSIMSTGGGRQVMFELLSAASVFGEPWSPDPHATAYNCGRASVGRQVLALIMASDEHMYLLMMREANERLAFQQQSHRDRALRRQRYESGWRPGDDDPPVDPGNRDE